MPKDGAFDEPEVEDDYRGWQRVTTDYQGGTRLFGAGDDWTMTDTTVPAGRTVPTVGATATADPSLPGVVAR